MSCLDREKGDSPPAALGTVPFFAAECRTTEQLPARRAACFGANGLGLRGCQEGIYFVAGQAAPSAGIDAADCDVADARADQLLHGTVQRCEHAADLPFAAFVNGHFHPADGCAAVVADKPGFGRRGLAVFEHDTFAQRCHLLERDLAAHFGHVGLGDFVRRMGEAVSEIAVIGEDEKPLGVNVKTTDGVDGRGDALEQFDYGALGVRVRPGAGIAARLVQQYVDLIGKRAYGAAVNGYRRCVGVSFGAEFGDDSSIYGDSTGGNQLFAFPARTESRSRQRLLQSFFHISCLPSGREVI